MECRQCHINNNFSIVDNQTCHDCHAGYDANFAAVHSQDFGSNCLGCHDGFDRMRSFDHSQTGYALEGKHSTVKCTGCHKSTEITDISAECKDCHAEPVLHQGLFDPTCNSCHTPVAWSPALVDGKVFSHFTSTGFSLDRHEVDYSDQVMICSTCHPDSLEVFSVQTCVDCHGEKDRAFMTEHQDLFGTDCLVCHDGVDRLGNFSHNAIFPLDGKHAEIQCDDCHANKVFRNTPVNCVDCHPEPELHAGLFGVECNLCHGTEDWSPAQLKNHNFPLDHGLTPPGTLSKCDVCHPTSYIEYTCYTCHEHQVDEIRLKHLEEGINEQDLPKCVECHPTGIKEEVGEG
jgi:hypothetical protein